MMLVIIIIILGIIGFACSGVAAAGDIDWLGGLSVFILIVTIALSIFGFCHGFINYPKTEGVHQGVITAVDLEGVYFRRYEIYLKSSGYKTKSDGTITSDETKYLIYADEDELAEELKSLIGKEVKLYYGHDGGYIGWNSCGTYHIKSVEEIEK